MRKFRALLRKELRELLTPQLFAAAAVTLALLVLVGRLAGQERRDRRESRRAAVMDRDASPASRAAVAALRESGYEVGELAPQASESAVAAAQGRWPVLVVFPEGFGRGLGRSAPQKLEVTTFLRSLSLSASFKAAAASRIASAVNESVSLRLLSSGARSADPGFLRRPVSSRDFVALGGRRAQVSMGQVIGFIQAQATLIPMVMLLVIVMAAQMVATAVANEKENKTLETLLSLPVDRDAIVLAKLCAAGLVAFLFTGVYLAGFRLYMHEVAGDLLAAGLDPEVLAGLRELGLTLTASGYGLVWVSMFFGILCALAIAMILGLLSDDVKGAQIATMPIVVLVMIPYLLSLMTDLDAASPALRALVLAIPFSHPFLAVTNVLTGHRLLVLGGIAYEAAVALAFVLLAARLFSSEAVFTFQLGRPRRPLKDEKVG